MGALLRQLAQLLRALTKRKAVAGGRSRPQLPAAPPEPIASRLARAQLGPRQPGARVWKLPSKGGPPNGILKTVDHKGRTTRYIEYDAQGNAMKRVDLTGKPHGKIPVPHVVDYVGNCGRGGEIFVTPSRRARPARPEEIP